MQPRAHLLANPCTKSLKGLFLDCLISSPDARANLFEGLCNMLSSKAGSLIGELTTNLGFAKEIPWWNRLLVPSSRP